MTDTGATAGAVSDLRVVELASERCAFAGKLFADMGASVVTVEPRAGCATRSYGPFLADESGKERSLYWWHYNTSKRGITLDLDTERGRELLRDLVRSSDLLIESETPGRLESLGLDFASLRALRPDLIMVSLSPFGASGPRADELATDLTVLAAGGPVWMNGYDDHSLPPVRGGGNQGYHTGCHFAVLSALVALLVRDQTGQGQHVDVNMHAAANVTTEGGSYQWLLARETVQRQTGQHASTSPSLPSQVQCADGRYVNTGVPPRFPHEFRAMYEWVVELGLKDEFPEAVFLEMGMQHREQIDLFQIDEDEEVQAIFGAGREAVNLIASKLPAYEFFMGAQTRGLSVAIIYSPEEVFEDPHFVARGFQVEVEHPELGRSFKYPGAPYLFHGSPWNIARRAPLLGEHNAEIYSELGVSAQELERLSSEGIV